MSLKIVCKEVVNGYARKEILGEWTFTPDIDEMHIEREYDGKQYQYYLYKYNFPKRPDWSQDWFTPMGSSANPFHTELMKVNQMWNEESPKYVCEKGEYCFSVTADKTISQKYRRIKLFITVI